MAGPKSRVTNVVVEGPLAPFAAAYRSRLGEAGYRPLTIVNELRQVAHLSRWMEFAHVAASDLTTARLEEFLAPRRAAKGSRACSFQELVLLLEVLIGQGVLPDSSTPPPPDSARQETLVRFQTYLLAERGLAACTAGAYVERARRFLEGSAWSGNSPI